MKITCASCHGSFTASASQRHFIDSSKTKGMKMVMLSCDHCGLSFPLRLETQDKPSTGTDKEILRCPVATCDGYAVRISDATDFAYGCGECGTVWSTRADLDRDIRKIIATFPIDRGFTRSAASG